MSKNRCCSVKKDPMWLVVFLHTRFNTDPDNTKPVTGRYMAKAVESQVWV